MAGRALLGNSPRNTVGSISFLNILVQKMNWREFGQIITVDGVLRRSVDNCEG